MSEAPRSSAVPIPDSESEHIDFVCPNCGHEDKGKYCSNCGQKVIHAEDLTLKHAWHHIMHEAVHVDGKIFTTLKLLITQPGQLTLDFWAGRRARHVHPIRLFLLIGVVFFFFAHFSSPIAQPEIFATKPRFGIKPLDDRMEQSGKTAEELKVEIEAKVAAALKPLYIGTILAQGFSLWLLYRRQRPYLAEHMVVALHLASFAMLTWIALGWLLLVGVPRNITGNAWTLVNLFYFLFSLRRIYGGSWPVLLWRWLVINVFAGLIIVGTLMATVVLVLKHY